MSANAPAPYELPTRPTLRFTIVVGGGTVLMTLLITVLVTVIGGTGDPAIARAAGERFTLPLIIHLATVIPALPLGAYLLWRRKGDALHKALGKLWAALMVITAIDSFWLNGVNGGFSFIHLFSIWTLISVPRAVFAIRRGNIKAHDRSMTGLYIGLVVAGFFTLIPGRVLGSFIFG